ncbi:MAG: peptidylprolyl isomerase [Acidimicrobiia bacterium]
MSKATKRERQKENRERARIERERIQKRQRQMKTTRALLFILVPIMAIFIIVTVTSGGDGSSSFDAKKGYTATIETSDGNIVVALDAAKAPIATEHFVKLVDEKFYDGLCIDRLSRDFVIQGGSPKCDAKGGSGSSVNGETPTDHYPVGSLAAAKTGSDPAGTFDSSFFIVTGSQGSTLPNDYARFGTVVSGLDVAQKIEGLPIKNGASDGPPATKITIKRIRITVTKSPATTSSTAAATTSTTAAPATTSTTK